MAVDRNDGVWVHNLNTNKLIKFDSFLNIDQQWDCSHQDLFTGDFGNSNLSTNHDGSLVYWYRGSHECVVIDVDSKQVVEEFDYITDECQVMNGVYPLKDQNFLLTVSNNQAGDDVKIVLFDTKKAKISSKHTLSSLTKGTRPLTQAKKSRSRPTVSSTRTPSSVSRASINRASPSCRSSVSRTSSCWPSSWRTRTFTSGRSRSTMTARYSPGATGRCWFSCSTRKKAASRN